MSELHPSRPLGLFIQPACLQHRYIRHTNSSHIFERPERLRAVLLGVAAAVARLEEADSIVKGVQGANQRPQDAVTSSASEDLSNMLSGLSIHSTFIPPNVHLTLPSPPTPGIPGQILQHHPALQLAHSPPPEEGELHGASLTASSAYLKDLLKWASEAVETIKETGCEIPSGMGLNQGDLYLGPGSVLAIEGAIQTVCQAIDRICECLDGVKNEPSTPPSEVHPGRPITPSTTSTYSDEKNALPNHNKAFCAIRPPGHHCGEDTPSGFCYVNNVVVGALHAYLEHDVDRAIIIDFDLHHGNGTQALIMPLNAASHAEDVAVRAGKPNPPAYGRKGKRRRGWKGFYGSVHDIYSYPCEDGDLDLIRDASISLAAHGQYIENIHLQPYTSEADFYERIYPKYLALLERAKVFMQESEAEPDRTIVLISAGFDACEHEHQSMQRHDRRVPTSFFARYTRDIITFADTYTQGKVVSVLEGGYSDRALTSAAMGHVFGMLDKSGDPSWWTEQELINIEKATKKKRTGKLAPFPTELSHMAHLVRTHALLAHFEGTSPDTIVPSANNTPQQGSRMTLRERRKLGLGDEDAGVGIGAGSVTPPAGSRRGAGIRGRGGAVHANSTPRSKLIPADNVTPSERKTVDKAATSVKATLPFVEMIEDGSTLEVAKAEHPGQVIDRLPNPNPPALDGLSSTSTAYHGLGSTLGSSNMPPNYQTPAIPKVEPLPQPPQQLQQSPTVPSDPQELSRPRIILRIPRIPSPSNSYPSPNPSEVPQHNTVYPILPTTTNRSPASSGQPAYREGSANTTSTYASETEYASATSQLSADLSREKSKTSTSSVDMPGRFGRE